MNFIYAVFICQAGMCNIYGDVYAGDPRARHPAPVYMTLDACRAAKEPPRQGFTFECFKKPDWTPAEDDAQEERDLSRPGPEAPSR